MQSHIMFEGRHYDLSADSCKGFTADRTGGVVHEVEYGS